MEDREILVKVEHFLKKFCKDLKTSLWYGIKDLYAIVSWNKNERTLRPEEFWTVKDINFEPYLGECLGLIGDYRAGKSTLLKILNGLINPDEGNVYYNSIITHDCAIGDFVKISPAVTLVGRYEIGSFSQIVTNTTILPDIIIGKNVIIFVGSCVTNDVLDNCLVVGIPTKIIKELTPLEF